MNPNSQSLRTVSHEPRTSITKKQTTTYNSTTTSERSSTSFDFPAHPSTTSTSPHFTLMKTQQRHDHNEEEEDLRYGTLDEQSCEGEQDEDQGRSSYAELRILPSTTTSIVTTTTTMTTHFAPIRIPKPSTSGGSSKLLFGGLRELIDRENHQDSRYEEDGDDLDLKMYPLSQTEWDASGLGNFKVELGDLTARFQHDPSSGKGKGKGKSVTAGRTSVDKAVDVKGKGKERQQNDRSEIIGSSKSGTIDSRRLSSPTTTTFLGDRRSSTVNTRGSPGPPPRKRPRSDAHDMEEGADENVKMKTVSLPSPNQSPPSPVPTSGGGDDSQDTFLPNLDASFDQPRPPSVPLQNFNLGQSPAIPALLSLPDLVDTFDQLSPSLQSYLIFSLLRRSSIPVLQTVANIISPALRRDFLSDLPPELSVQILGYLDPTTLCRASLVCKNWRKLVDGEWRIWKRMMDQDGLWIGDGSEEKEAREIVTGKKENWFLKRWKAGVWDQNKKSSWNGKVDSDRAFVDNVNQTQQEKRRPSTSSVRLASPSSSREPSPIPLSALPVDDQPHSVHPYKILYRRRWLTRRNWKQAEPKRTTFTSSTATTNVVTCLQFDEEKIVSASDDADHSIHVFDTQSGSERAELRGHEGGVWALQYIGNVLVSGSTDRSVRVWDLDSARCTHEFLGHTSTVRCLQIVEPLNVNPDPNGEPIWEPPYPLVVTGSRDWTLRVWRLPLAGKDREYHPVEPMSPTEGVSEPTDNPYYERQLSGHRHAVRAVAAAGRTVVSGSYDHHVRVWDLLTGECKFVLEGHSLKVYSVVLDHHRKQCASGSMDGTVKLWSIETGEQLHSLDGHSSLVGLLGLSRRCLVSAAADWTLRIWNPETGECRHALNAHQGAITCFQHDEYKIVSGSDGTLKMWDTQTGDFVRDLLANLTGVWQVAFNERYCIAAVQRNGASEFELLDFGSVSEDEIKSDRRDGGRGSISIPRRGGALSTPSPPTPTRNADRDPSPATMHHNDTDTDMVDSSHPLPQASSSTSTPSASTSRQPPALRGPSQVARFRSPNSRTTTPDNVSSGPEETAAPGGGTGATLRRIESSRNLVRRDLGFSNDSPSVQADRASMDVDEAEGRDESLEQSERVGAEAEKGSQS